LSLARLNIRTWLTWYLNCCAENGGRAPSDITPFMPWEMSVEKRRELAIDPNDTS
jgi:transposase